MSCLCLTSRSWYSFTDRRGMEGWVGLGWLVGYIPRATSSSTQHPPRPLAGRGAQAPCVWTQTLVPLNFSAVVAPLLVTGNRKFWVLAAALVTTGLHELWRHQKLQQRRARAHPLILRCGLPSLPRPSSKRPPTHLVREFVIVRWL